MQAILFLTRTGPEPPQQKGKMSDSLSAAPQVQAHSSSYFGAPLVGTGGHARTLESLTIEAAGPKAITLELQLNSILRCIAPSGIPDIVLHRLKYAISGTICVRFYIAHSCHWS
jgi:hypothetical protein